MNISEMHVWFRQYAQQMGMQNVRAILPEQIDILINTSISDTVNQLIKENIGITNDRVITDNSKIGQINAFQTLYKVALLKLYDGSSFRFEGKDRNVGKMQYDPIVVNTMPDFLYLVDFSISYRVSLDGIGTKTAPHVATFDNDALETNYYPVRLIDDAYLADSLNDFVLKNRFRSPIIVTYNTGTYDLYIDKFTQKPSGQYTLLSNLVPYELRVAYLSKPAIVKFADDIDPTQSVNCDLPETMHVDIIKHAVDLYRIAVSGALNASRQQESNQESENARNNVRNEGY